jgi:hypothetical protein
MTNDRTTPMQANQPDTGFQLERIAGHKAYWYADMRSQYNCFDLAPESRDLAAIWTPLGLIRPTRGAFGLKNMGIWVQGHVTKTLTEELSPYATNHMANIADDFTGWADHVIVAGEAVIDWQGMADVYIEFLELCDRNNWQLRPEKTFFGSHDCEYFGHVVNEDGIRTADHNLRPIEVMVPPRDRKELQSVMGFLASIAPPLTSLHMSRRR